MRGSLFSLLRTQELSALYKRAIRSFWEGENWKLDLQIYIKLLGFFKIKRDRKEQFALLKSVKERFARFVKKWAIRKKNQRAESQPWQNGL